MIVEGVALVTLIAIIKTAADNKTRLVKLFNSVKRETEAEVIFFFMILRFLGLNFYLLYNFIHLFNFKGGDDRNGSFFKDDPLVFICLVKSMY